MSDGDKVTDEPNPPPGELDGGFDGGFELVMIGGGNMGAALLGGLLESAVVAPELIALVETNADRRAELAQMFPEVTIGDSVPTARSAILAVKPQHVADAIADTTSAGITRLLSIAAGVTLGAMAANAGDEVTIIRAMPNTPALVGRAVHAIAAGPGASEADVEWAKRILGATGMVVEVDESQIDAVTGLTGSGPAYIFRVAEALIEAGIAEGLPPDLVEPMVTQLLVGSSALLADRGDPAGLRVAVTSPGGTTAAGLAVLDDREVPAAFRAAVRAATERSRELGN